MLSSFMICKECDYLKNFGSILRILQRFLDELEFVIRVTQACVILWRTIVDGFDRASHCHEVRAQLKQLHFRFLYANITRYILFDVVIVDCNC